MDVQPSGFIRSGGLRNKFKNCIEIILEKLRHKGHKGRHKGSLSDPCTSASRPLNNKCYSANALRTIGDHVQHEHRLRILPFRVISRVRSLKLNHKPQKNRRSNRAQLHQRGPVHANLINVKSPTLRKQGNITIGMCNVQSLQNKELQISELISDYSLDLLVLTETWLTSNHQFWKDTTILNKYNLRLHTLDRGRGRGGGLTLVTKRHL